MSILKEFDLDIPYKSNKEHIEALMHHKGLEYLQATKLDYDENWKDKRILFRDQIRCVCSMYTRLFEKYKTKNCWKVLVECVPIVSDQRILDFSGVYTVEVGFDINLFFSSSNYEKKKLTLQALKNGIDIIVKQHQWDQEVFDKAYEEVVLNDYVNYWVWRKPVKSPTKKYFAEVSCSHHVDFLEIYLTIMDRNREEVIRKKILTERPNEFAYAIHLGELKWLSANEVALINKKGTEQWSVSL